MLMSGSPGRLSRPPKWALFAYGENSDSPTDRLRFIAFAPTKDALCQSNKRDMLTKKPLFVAAIVDRIMAANLVFAEDLMVTVNLVNDQGIGKS
jgi:hypothetical protein